MILEYFGNSSLFQALHVRLANTKFHLLSDTAYPISVYVMVPFKRNRELGENELAFNLILKSDRQRVERAIGLKKMKWRRLKFLDVFNLQNAHTMLTVMACLHNFGLEYDGWIDDAPEIPPEIDDNEEDFFENNDNEEEIMAGLEKRRRMAEDLIA
jgi:hypothetical protein